jgi:hypothetical protein
MRTQIPAVALIALLGFGCQATAQTPCPELARLRSEVAEALKRTRGAPTLERCVYYNRFATAWDAVVQYANDNRDVCDISTVKLNDFEKYHRDAEKARDNVCAGRPARPYPPDIIQR